MRKYKKILAIGIAIMSFLLSGCGTPVYEMTLEEEELIVQAAAYYVAKYNIYQKDGISRVYGDDETDESKPGNSENDSENDSESGSEDTNTENGGADSDKEITIADAVGMDSGLQVTYKGSEVIDHVSEGSGYSVDAGAGFMFYVMKFEVKNSTDKDIEVDNVSVAQVFKMTSGTIKTNSSLSFLSSDMSTYKGKIVAGESVEMVLLFKIKEADAGAVKDPKLEITIDGKTKVVQL